MPDGRNARPGRRMSRRAGARSASSVELLLELAARPDVGGLLSEHGVDAGRLGRLPARDAARDGPHEPADWHHRLLARGRAHTDLEQLLALVRTPECDAYRLLEAHGVSCMALRKAVIERTRALGDAGPERGTPSPPARPRPHPPSTPPRAAPPARSLRRGESPIAEPAAAPARTEASPARAASPTPIDPRSLAPLEGRTVELARLADAVSRALPRPPLLVGEHGSGRTLLASHLARTLDRPVFRLLAHDFEDDAQLRETIRSIDDAGGVAILDDLDRLATEAAPPFLGALAAAWTTGDPPIVTLASHETRARLTTWLPGLRDLLDAIVLAPMDLPTVTAAVKLAVPSVLDRHRIRLSATAHPSELCRVADRFLGAPAMPGRALDLLDLACARAARAGRTEVDARTWHEIVSERTGLPLDRIAGTGDQDLLDLDAELRRRIVGHDRALEAVTQLVRRNRAGFSSQRPIASILLLGPSGVGKTELAKALADALFVDGSAALLRLDMSEYAEAHAVSRIVGAPPGYVGHEQGGALTDPLLASGHRVILLDEIEKAHRDVHQLLLQVFDEGRLTDGRGRTVDFRRAIVIMTSNLGSTAAAETHARDADVLAVARAAFPVELWNRIEAPLVLHPLDREQLERVCRRLAHRSSERLLAERGIAYELDASAREHLVDLAGEDPSLGARPLRHLLARRVEARIADAVLRGSFRAGNKIRVSYDGREIQLSRVGRA
jgi:ATP-dependent Clp protease ATP-binding subunit ClpC